MGGERGRRGGGRKERKGRRRRKEGGEGGMKGRRGRGGGRKERREERKERREERKGRRKRRRDERSRDERNMYVLLPGKGSSIMSTKHEDTRTHWTKIQDYGLTWYVVTRSHIQKEALCSSFNCAVVESLVL